MTIEIGSRHEVEISRVAHGGHCVGRIGEVVVFVRHTLPGEKVIVEVSNLGKQGKFVFADAVDVLQPSPHRIVPACEVAGVCGGCDWQHVEFNYQQELKTEILKEQLIRLGKISPSSDLLQNLKVSALPGDKNGLGYRTRVEYVTDARGRIGFRKHGSNEVVAVSKCLVAVDDITGDGFSNVPWEANSEIKVVKTSVGEVVRLASSDQAEYRVTERVADFTYQINAKSFWQAHVSAPEVFVKTALEMLQLKLGEHVCDLYSGSGLFTIPIAKSVGAGGRVDSIEGDLKAVSSLKRNARAFSNINVFAMGVEKWLHSSKIKKVDAVLLDPPRSGAGSNTVKGVTRMRPSRVLYVACDPASLARDVQYFAENGYDLTEIRAWDAFGQTQHLETFALFRQVRLAEKST